MKRFFIVITIAIVVLTFAYNLRVDFLFFCFFLMFFAFFPFAKLSRKKLIWFEMYWYQSFNCFFKHISIQNQKMSAMQIKLKYVKKKIMSFAYKIKRYLLWPLFNTSHILAPTMRWLAKYNNSIVIIEGIFVIAQFWIITYQLWQIQIIANKIGTRKVVWNRN